MKQAGIAFFLLFGLSMWMTGCGGDDYVYPSVLTELIDLRTDGEGVACQVVTDEGVRWNIRNQAGLDGLVPDTVYRAVSMYEPLDEDGMAGHEVKLYNTQLAVSPVPVPANKFKEVKTDLVAVQSIWRSGNYLNLILQVKVKDRKHAYHFVEDSLENRGDGRMLHLTLYHDRNEDVEGFDRTVYLSVPLWAYAGILTEGDSVRFRLRTYKDGMTFRTFPY